MGDLIEAPSLETFQNHVASSFSVEGNDDIELTLTTVDTSKDDVDGWQRFRLVFEGEEGLFDDVYRLSSDDLDQFDVALSPNATVDPVAANDEGPATIEYEAVFHRRDPGRDVQTEVESE